MIYLDHGATSFPKPPAVRAAVLSALQHCTNPGRGGYPAAMVAANVVYGCREAAGKLFFCGPEQVVLTGSCTQGLNMAIRTLVKPGARVLISGFEHNAVTWPLHALGAIITVAGRKLFDWDEMLEQWEKGLKKGQDAAVFTCVSNVFGYMLPVTEMAALCRQYEVPFVLDGAQAAGMLPIDFGALGADFLAAPGHKGLLGPQGTGLLLCARLPEALLFGGTGSLSRQQAMPDFLPDRAEAGTLNVPGIAGLAAGIRGVLREGPDAILRGMGLRVFAGAHQSGTVSFVPGMDCEKLAEKLAKKGIAVRAGLHCAPLAHESAGTLESGTVRVSFGHEANSAQTAAFLRTMREIG